MQDTPFSRFKQDARRWIFPGQICNDRRLSFLLVCGLLHSHMPLRAMACYRIASWCRIHRIPLLVGYFQRRIMRQYGLEIEVGADICGGLYIPHPVGTVISAKRIGRNCNIIASVTIGMRNEWDFPTIGDNVFIGAGARILGGITIGDGAVIGANAVVIHDVPPGATAVGIPARVIEPRGARVEEDGSPDIEAALSLTAD
jgi:serine O-acetyltransferase